MSAAAVAVERNPREILFEVRDLCVHFPGPSGPVRAVDGVDLELYSGETVALVGESGCGKSTLARALVGLSPITRGSVRFRGEELDFNIARASARYAAPSSSSSRTPTPSLNPRLTVRATLAEAIALHQGLDARGVERAVGELLESVGLDPNLADRYPHEFSGGQRQRISVARALAVRPSLILCDEVTSALDVSVQAQILELLKSLQEPARRRVSVRDPRFGLGSLHRPARAGDVPGPTRRSPRLGRAVHRSGASLHPRSDRLEPARRPPEPRGPRFGER